MAPILHSATPLLSVSFGDPGLRAVIADQSPPRSLASMQAHSQVADRVVHLPHWLCCHEEFGDQLAAGGADGLLRG